MKRVNGLFEQIIQPANLALAEAMAKKGKKKQYGVISHNRNIHGNLEQLHLMLSEKSYRTSEYTTFKVFEPKERLVYRLPFFPDRITHHAIMNIMEPIWVSLFTADTYSCIKGKGIHGAANNLRKSLKDTEGTKYCLKLDIKKFYPSIDHEILKTIIRKKIKDTDLLWLLDEIIDSAHGVPIGNYLSQYFANLYLAYFDHWIKEEKGVSHYFRYADDILVLSHDKQQLHSLLHEIRTYLNDNLKLQIKGNYQIFPVKDRGIDFVGYVFYHTHTLLRKSIKKNFIGMLANNGNQASFASYMGWVKHCDSKHLILSLMKKFSELGIVTTIKHRSGEKVQMSKILNRPIEVHGFDIEPSNFKDERLCIHFAMNGKRHIVFTSSKILQDVIQKVGKDDFPFEATIVEEDKHFEFK